MRVFSVALVLVAGLGCNDAITAAPAAALREVTVEAASFTPNNVTIRQGGTVRFLFLGTPHNIIFTEQPGRPENIQTPVANTTEERVFETADTYSYTCSET